MSPVGRAASRQPRCFFPARLRARRLRGEVDFPAALEAIPNEIELFFLSEIAGEIPAMKYGEPRRRIVNPILGSR